MEKAYLVIALLGMGFLPGFVLGREVKKDWLRLIIIIPIAIIAAVTATLYRG